tara:strand:+ start:5257 stop:5433 length:177 start_codon:yes stop_codon:yes gene_type:complete
MKVGDLVQMNRNRDVKDLPVGIIVDTDQEDGGREIWCMILWGDGSQYSAWSSELMTAK